MGLIVRPNTYATGTASSAEANANEITIYDEFNGNISNANVDAAALIAQSKIATLVADLADLGVFDVRVTDTADRAIPNNVVTALTWNAETFDTDGMHSTVANTNRLTFTRAGKYMFGATIFWDSDTTTPAFLEAQIRDSGAVILQSDIRANVSGRSMSINITGYGSFLVADWIEVAVLHNTGAALDVSLNRSNFWATRIGA